MESDRALTAVQDGYRRPVRSCPSGKIHGKFAGEDNYLRKVGSPWNREMTEKTIADPNSRPADWVWEAVTCYIDYCLKNFGQWPATYNPMQAHFGGVIHNVDEEFYDLYYAEGYITDRIRKRAKIWHD